MATILIILEYYLEEQMEFQPNLPFKLSGWSTIINPVRLKQELIYLFIFKNSSMSFFIMVIIWAFKGYPPYYTIYHAICYLLFLESHFHTIHIDQNLHTLM